MKRYRILPCLLILLLCAACRVLQETPVSSAAPAEFSAAPEAETILLFEEPVSKSTESITLHMPVESFAPAEDALTKLPCLREAVIVFPVDWTDDPQGYLAYLTFRDAHPELTFTERYPEGCAPSEISELTITQPIEALESYLAQFPALQTLTLPSELSRETIASLTASHPAIRFLWTDAAFGASDSAAQTLTVSGDADFDTLRAYLACFPVLETVDLRACTLTEADGNALCDAFPAVAFGRTVTLNGVPTDTGITEYNLDNAEIDFDALLDTLHYFPILTHLEMNDCSLTDAQLAALRDRYPEKGIVWTVHIRNYSIRTDSVAFSTQCGSENPNRLTSSAVDPLRYCTDLIALDLGHNDITDLDFLLPLQNLQVLILSDSRRLTDISVIGTLKKLKYLELFLTSVNDVSPLASLSELLDVNLCITKVVDPTPLMSCNKLERIWIGIQTQKYMNKERLLQLQKAFPNADFDLISVSCTACGWREHPRYEAYRKMFATDTPVEPFLP